MDATEAIKKLKKIQVDDDTEEGHINGDKVLCDLLISLGYKDVVDEYDKIRKWYA